MSGSTRREFFARSGALLLIPPLSAQGPPERHLLSAAWPADKLAGVLLPREKWAPFPTAEDRGPWQGLPEEARQSAIRAGERHLGAEWPSLPATLFLQYARNGNRSNYEGVRSRRRRMLSDLVLAECAESKGRFLDDILNGIWTTCEETFWGVPAHLGLQKAGPGLPDVTEPVVDLFAAETGSLLAWVDYLLAPQLDRLSPLLRPRLRLEMNRRILVPNYERTDFWWMGLGPKQRAVNNWNPWINSNWLTCALLMEQDGQRRVATVHKILTSLDRFLDVYHSDGGCDEGPGYWSRAGGSLFDCLELLHSATGGAVSFYEMPLVRQIGRYIVRAHIYDDYFIDFADASAKLRISADLVFRYGRRIGDEDMQALGAFAAAHVSSGHHGSESIGRELPALFDLDTLRAAPAYQPLLRDVWLDGIQVVAARRKERSADGLYLAAKGGHNAESHNHNDVGNFIVYADGKPLLIDVGVGTYSAKTFSSKRYEIWTMQSAYHNLPAVDGVMQSPGRQFAAREVAYSANGREVTFSQDIAGAYPPEAGLEFWKRVLRFDRAENRIEVLEDYSLKKKAARITLTLMTPCRVGRSAPGELVFSGSSGGWGSAKLLYDAKALAPSVEEITIEDARLKSVWGERLYRVLLAAEKPPSKAAWTLRLLQG